MEEFIKVLRKSDRYIKAIYSEGGCHQFHLVLKHLFPESIPYINADANHVVTFYKGKYYDITGQVEGEYYPMLIDEIQAAEKWSFSKSMALQVSECPACGEPIVI